MIAASQDAGLALMKIDTLAVEAEEVKADITESGDLQMATSEVMAIYAVTGLDEAHPVFIDHVTLSDGVTVTVTAAEGVLPEGTYLSVEEVTTQVADAVKESLEAEGKTGVSEVLAYDINLMVDGEKLESEYWNQEDKVKVTFSGPKIQEISENAETVEIAPIQTPVEEVKGAKGGVTEVAVLEEISAENVSVLADEIQTVQEAGDEASGEFSIDAEHFTIYVVVGNTRRATLNNVTVNVYALTDPWESTIMIDGKSYSKMKDQNANFILAKEPTIGGQSEKVSSIKITDGTNWDAVYYKTSDNKYIRLDTESFSVTKTGSNRWPSYTITAQVPSEDGIVMDVPYDGEHKESFFWLTKVSYPLYYYALLPQLDQTMQQVDEIIKGQESETAGNYWIAMGEGTRSTNVDPSTYVPEHGYGYDIYKDNAEDPLAQPPTRYLNEVIYISNSDGTYGKYILDSSPGAIDKSSQELQDLGYAGTFSLVWSRTRISNGRNSGLQVPEPFTDKTGSDKTKGTPESPSNTAIQKWRAKGCEPYNAYGNQLEGTTYHRDGFITLMPFGRLNVTFNVQMPKSEDGVFERIESYSVLEDDETKTKKSVIGSTAPKPVLDGYTFIGWYEDRELKQPADFGDGRITRDMDYYGKYISNQQQIRLVKTFETPSDWPVDAAGLEKVRFALEKGSIGEDGTISFGEKVDLAGSPNAADRTKTFTIDGLMDSKTVYRLTEEETVIGYKKLEEPVYFQIVWNAQDQKVGVVFKGYDSVANKLTDGAKDYADVSWTQGDDKLAGSINVLNHHIPFTAVLPDTGGPGLLQMNRFGWLLLLIALMMAGTEVRYFGTQKNRVESGVSEDRYPFDDWL